MGREARCHARWPGGEGEVKALLETHELILRGDLRRTLQLSEIAEARVAGEALVLRAGDGEIALELGAAAAASWARKIATPPPTLAAKLGVGPHCRALVSGEVEDANLEEALRTALATTPGEAHLALAVIASEADLAAALDCHRQLPDDAPIWLINVKGPKSPFGENAIRTAMRAAGFVDTKTASVSDVLAGSRYARRRG
jgi:hypothetical protein